MLLLMQILLLNSILIKYFIIKQPNKISSFIHLMSHLLFLVALTVYLATFCSAQAPNDPYCISNSADNKCSKCIDFFYLKDNVCTKVSPSCNTYNQTIGVCLTCVEGFTLIEGGKCQSSIQGFNKPHNLQSAVNKSSSTILKGNQKIVSSSSLRNNEQTQIQPQSNFSVLPTPIPLSSTSNTPPALSSVPTLPPSLPILSQQSQSQTLKSQIANSNSQNGFIFLGESQNQLNHNQVSQPIRNSASTSITTTITTTEQSNLSNNQNSDNNPYEYPPGFLDPYCQKYENNGQCIKCATRFFFNVGSGLCSPVNTQCNTYNNQGQCLSCYQGYSLSGTNCIVSPNQQPSDSNCKTFSSNGNCLACYSSFILNNGRCKPVNPQCKDYNTAGGCTDCYAGYSLKGAQCVVTVQNSVNSQDLCKQRVNNQCLTCYGDNSVVNGVCVPSLSLCQSIDSQSNCVSCYSGYVLINGRCRIADLNTGCSKFDPQGKCTECSKGYYYQTGGCRMVNPLCQTFNQTTGACQSCYSGYVLSGTNCIVAQNLVSGDQNCFEMKNGVCITCSNRFVMLGGRCSPVNDYCNTYNNVTGDCTSCYGGFALRYGYCYKTIVANTVVEQQLKQQSTDVGLGQMNTTTSQTQPNITVVVNSQARTTPTAEQIFYEWLNKDKIIPESTYLFSTQSAQQSLQINTNTNSTQNSNPSNLASQTIQQIASTVQNNLKTNQSQNKNQANTNQPQITSTLTPNQIQNPSTLPISTTFTNTQTQSTNAQYSLPPLAATASLPPSSANNFVTIQPKPLFANFIASTSLLHSGNPCLKYDTDGITCLECSSSWNLTSGNCLLATIAKDQHN